MEEIAPIEAYAVLTGGKLDADMIFNPENWSLDELIDLYGGKAVYRVAVVPIAKERG